MLLYYLLTWRLGALFLGLLDLVHEGALPVVRFFRGTLPRPWWPPRKRYRRLPNQTYTPSEGQYLAYGSRPRYIGSLRLRESKLPTHHCYVLAVTACLIFPRRMKATIRALKVV